MCQVSELKIHRKCTNPTDPIAVLIMKDEKQIGLCSKCWTKVAESDYEWGDEPRIKNFKKWLEEGRGLKGVVETIYDPTKKGSERYKKVDENIG